MEKIEKKVYKLKGKEKKREGGMREVMKKGERKKVWGKGMGSMGNQYKVSESFVLPGRQREQGCGCCLSLT